MKNAFLMIALALPLLAAGDSGIVQYKGSDLTGYEKKLAPKMNDKKVATEQLAKWGNHLMMVAHREASGEAELHKKQVDIFIVETGEGTLVVGGTVVSGKETAPNEIRGASIQGGKRMKLAPGDVVHIPANTPHQTLVDSGKQITYAVVKIDSE